jgi:hypothetical protein
MTGPSRRGVLRAGGALARLPARAGGPKGRKTHARQVTDGVGLMSRSTAVTIGSGTPVAAPIVNLPTQPGAILYGSTSGVSAYAHPGALLIVESTLLGNQVFKDAAAAGCTILAYLDTVAWNTNGIYHQALYNSSAYGAAVPQWGTYMANTGLPLADFRVGGIEQGKVAGVLGKIVTDFPHIGGFFADDLGSRSWFPLINWSTFPSGDKADYRAGAIALTQTFRTVCDSHGLVFMVNGTWAANDGGGYPDATQHGNSLADGGMVEHHDGEIAFWQTYAASTTQWATSSPITNGKAINFAVMAGSAGVTEFVNANVFSHVCLESDYTLAAPTPWGSFHATNLPTHAS